MKSKTLNSLSSDLKKRIKRLEELMGENAERKKEFEALKSKKE